MDVNSNCKICVLKLKITADSKLYPKYERTATQIASIVPIPAIPLTGIKFDKRVEVITITRIQNGT